MMACGCVKQTRVVQSSLLFLLCYFAHAKQDLQFCDLAPNKTVGVDDKVGIVNIVTTFYSIENQEHSIACCAFGYEEINW